MEPVAGLFDCGRAEVEQWAPRLTRPRRYTAAVGDWDECRRAPTGLGWIYGFCAMRLHVKCCASFVFREFP